MRYLIRLFKKIYQMVEPHESRLVMNNVAFLSGLQAITYALPVVILPYLFRVIGPEKFGLIAFAQAFVQYFMIITDYGFSVSATKQISLAQHEHDKVREIFSSVMMVKIALAFLSFLILGTIVYFVPRFRSDWLVYILSFGVVIGNTLFPVWFFQGTEKMQHIAELNILGEIAYAFLIIFFVRVQEDYIMIPLITSAVFFVNGVLGQYIVFKKFGVTFKLQGYKNIQQQLNAGWNIFISAVAINAYTTSRVFAIGLLTNNTVTGAYSIAEKIANVAQTFPLMSFSQAIFPRLSKIYQKNKLKALEIMHQIQFITINVASICLPIIFIFAPFIVRIACGGTFLSTVFSLRLLLIAVFFISANAFRVQFLLVCGKTDTYSRIHVLMAMIGLPLIFFLISAFSYLGAAMATVFIEGGIFAMTYFAVKKLKF